VDRDADFGSYGGARVLVFGATGFIGPWLVRMAAQHGAHVVVAGRNAAAAAALREWSGGTLDSLECDVTDDDRVQRTVAAARPHITFNLAGYGVNPDERDDAEAHRVNGRFVGVLCAAVSRWHDTAWSGAALVNAGTQLEYGPITGELREELAPQPTTSYGRSKLQGTLALQECAAASGLVAIAARLFNVYGPGERAGRLLSAMMHAAGAGLDLPLTSGEQLVDFMYVEEVAEGLLRLGLAHGAEPGEIVNLAMGRLISVRAFAELAARQLGMPSERLLFGVLPPRAETLKYDAVSTERLRQLTGWTPVVDADDGIRRTIERQGRGYARN
jgi:nucleoside-diphosphate-sugar epimerase